MWRNILRSGVAVVCVALGCLLTQARGEVKKETVKDLVGTTWQFPGTTSKVTFLKDGKFQWNGSPATGSWKQTGNKVEINSNDFTLFELTMNGDSMVGTWKRLKGEDMGKKNYSALKKVTN